ncbi:hypothetical protein HELRODRAFT_162387 [Helobdella robusta]|uniref:Ig-like domain-containing protein n=1 Tax=Helobdella robusta TaxID=6412 RepID=T1ESL2_HELRO|nr:hypothetical protein HELRODRAFT_162387 [Helobdella robusta]ESN98918.1 hypothetical protein HELRODRAFT_162387 [Helobdella robusta]
MARLPVFGVASIFVIFAHFQVLNSFTVRLTPNIKEQTSNLGGSFVSTCSYDDVSPSDNVKIHWTDPYNKTIKDVDGNQRVYYEKVHSGLKLFVKHINEKDTGKYSCRVVVNGMPKEEHFKLTLLHIVLHIRILSDMLALTI